MGENQSIHSETVPVGHYTVEQLKELRKLARIYFLCDHHIAVLRQAGDYIPGYEENTSPWYTVKEGSYYLGNVYMLMKKYMEFNPNNIYDKHMQSVINTMAVLEYHPRYDTSGFTDEAYDGKTKVFISTGQGTMYHKLLYSKHRKDIRSFVEMVEHNIDIPLRKFMQAIIVELASRDIFD